MAKYRGALRRFTRSDVCFASLAFFNAILQGLMQDAAFRQALTYEDRLIIQQKLENGTSLHKIAQRLHKSDSTISRETIRKHNQVKTSANHTALCAHVNVCAMVSLCSADCNRTSCANCVEVCHPPRCPDYHPHYCTRLTKALHSCNGCPQWAAKTCRDVKFRCGDNRARVVADDLLSESRKGVSLQPEKLQYLDDLVSPTTVEPPICS